MISFWSVLSATLWFALAFLLLGALRGHTNFLMRHGTMAWSMAVVMTLMRLLFPLDSKYMFVIRSYKLLPVLRRALDYQPVAGVTVRGILAGLWIAGSLLWLGFVIYGMVRDRRQLWEIPAVPLTPEVKAAARQCGLSESMICMTPAVSSPMTMGLLHPTVFLPVSVENKDDWLWIMKHEMTHIAGHDAWLRLAFLMFRCLFWWNPLVHLAQKSLADILELRCDKTVLNNMGTEERAAYVGAMRRAMAQADQGVSPFIGASAFVQPSRVNTLVLRARTAIDAAPQWDKTAVAALVVSIALFLASFAFILQPAELPPETDESDVVSVISSQTTYLKRLPSGEYEFWSDGEFVCIVSADMLKDEVFQNLEVLP